MKFLLGRAFTLVVVLILGFSTPASAKWRMAESEHFVIYAEDSAKDLQKFAQMLENYHAAMAIVSGRTVDKPSPSNRVTIYIAGDQDDIGKLARTKSRYIQGFYQPRAAGSVAFVQSLSGNGKDLSPSMLVLLHEYAHHFLIASMRSSMPRWLSEGAAEFYAAARFPSKGGVEIGRPASHRAAELSFADNVTVHELLDPDLYAKRNSNAYDEFYGKSWALYHYLTFSSERKGQLGQYWRAMLAGKSSPDAAAEVFGDIGRLDREVSAYIKQRRMFLYTLAPSQITTGPIVVTELSDGAGAVMPLRMFSKRGVDTEEAAELVEEIRSVAAAYPDDAAVLDALAEAEYDAGNDEAAIAAADRAIALDPARTNPYVQKGYALFRMAGDAEDRDAAYQAAMKPFSQLNKLENNHPLPLIYYFRSFAERGLEPPEQAKLALEQAAKMAPFDKGLWLNVGMMQAAEGKIALAKLTLQPLANDPHGGGAAAAARTLTGLLVKASEGESFSIGNSRELLYGSDNGGEGEGGSDGDGEGGEA